MKRSTTSGGPYNSKLASPTGTNYTDAGRDKRHGLLLRCFRRERDGRKRQFRASQRHAHVRPTVNVTITIDPTKTKPISPWIYGINFYSGVTGAPPQLTFDRAGGNRWTAYNWETNASNAGSDYLYENDDYLSSSTVPAEAVRSFIAGDQSNNLASSDHRAIARPRCRRRRRPRERQQSSGPLAFQTSGRPKIHRLQRTVHADATDHRQLCLHG